MQVRMLKRYHVHQPGTVVEMIAGVASVLIKRKIAAPLDGTPAPPNKPDKPTKPKRERKRSAGV